MENKLREQIINEAEDCLKERIRKGVNKSEIDFLCGVASAMVGIEKYNGTDYEKLMQDVKLRDEMKAFKSPVDGHVIMKTFSLKRGKAIGMFKHRIEEAILDGQIKNDYESAFQYMMDIKDNILDN